MKKFMIALFALVFTVQSCKKEGLDKDPNRATQVTPDLVLNGICNSLYQAPWGTTARFCQYHCCNYNYYGTQEYNWGGASLYYIALKNVVKMEEEAIRVGNPAVNPYSALGKFFKAYFFYQMTMLVGDVPMKQALNPDNTQPEYDTQKDVFKQILTWLEEANNEMASLAAAGKTSFSGDIYFNNNLSAWRKANNAFMLRVLITLSKKEADADLNIKQRFSNVLADPAKYPLMSGNGDNLQYTYNSNFNKYPTNPDNFGFDATRYNMSATWLNTAADLKDPRVFFAGEPAGKKIKDGAAPTDYSAFNGAPSSMDLADMSTRAAVDNGAGILPGEFSFYNRKRYYSSYVAEPCIQIGYSEMCFNIAEAVQRGWAAGSAEDWYKNGIQASHAFFGIKNGPVDVYFFKAGGKVTNATDYDKYTINFDWNAYYNQPSVKYNNSLDQILVQKYLAFFQNSGWEGYFNFRRTGKPVFSDNGPGTANSGKIPNRFQYPVSERTNNSKNLAVALARQFGGADEINAEMWILK
jgi:hypothetical protein